MEKFFIKLVLYSIFVASVVIIRLVRGRRDPLADEISEKHSARNTIVFLLLFTVLAAVVIYLNN